MPLSMVECGRKVLLLGIRTDRELQARLAQMGLVPGVEVEVIRNSEDGPFILGVKGSRVMLGREMAGQLVVE
ncbi:MAG: FeoA family protein [Candidatus Latescibacterota bacterium]